jgi:hypothetical protein
MGAPPGAPFAFSRARGGKPYRIVAEMPGIRDIRRSGR